MEDNSFISRRRQIMAENGDDISIPHPDDQLPNPTTSADQIEILLRTIDHIIPPIVREDRADQPYSLWIRNLVTKLRTEEKSDDEIYEILANDIRTHNALARRLAQKGVTAINFFFPTSDQESDQ